LILGNMDCKVCGTTGGITAIQCDVKTPVELDVIIGALDLAKHGRDAILTEMDKLCKDTLGGLMPRSTMKTTAPRVEIISYDPVRKRDLIGPGGSVLRQLEDRFNVTLDLSQDGRCCKYHV
jgi:polyribonucleotide nucleotidyltransferase